MEWPHSNRRKNDPLRFRGPPTGPRDEQRGCRPWCVQVAVEGLRHHVQPQTCTTDMSNARVCVSRFAAHGHRKGWWSSWLEVIGLRSVNLGFESHERDWGGIKGGARCGAVRCGVRCGAVGWCRAGTAPARRGCGSFWCGCARPRSVRALSALFARASRLSALLSLLSLLSWLSCGITEEITSMTDERSVSSCESCDEGTRHARGGSQLSAARQAWSGQRAAGARSIATTSKSKFVH